MWGCPSSSRRSSASSAIAGPRGRTITARTSRTASSGRRSGGSLPSATRRDSVCPSRPRGSAPRCISASSADGSSSRSSRAASGWPKDSSATAASWIDTGRPIASCAWRSGLPSTRPPAGLSPSPVWPGADPYYPAGGRATAGSGVSIPTLRSSRETDGRGRGLALTTRVRWVLVVMVTVAVCALSVWLVWTDAPVYRFLHRLFHDNQYMKDKLVEWGAAAPVIFILIQALQVIVAPIPGEVTGILGGFVFGQWLGLIYSTIGLTIGSPVGLGLGRWLGDSYVRNLVSEETWNKLGFIVEAEGTILCFIIYLIPGLPKDIICYLFGLSPMPFWVFAVVQTLGRIPGTWVLSAQGAKTATGHYIEVLLLTAIVAALAVPLYYARHRIMAWFEGKMPPDDEPDGSSRPGLDI